MNDKETKRVAVRLLDTFEQVLRFSRNWGAGLEMDRQTDQVLVVRVEDVNVEVRVSICAAVNRRRQS